MLQSIDRTASGLNGEVNYHEAILATSDTRFAAVLCVFQAQLMSNCPLEWVDQHQSRESYVRYLENPNAPDYQPKPQVTFNFDARTCPKPEVEKGFYSNSRAVQQELETLLREVPVELKKRLAQAITAAIARSCHDALLYREELVKLIKSMPRDAKFDQIKNGRTIVRLGKNCSPELRHHYLSKLPT